ncbi:class I SAM-dependent methyltransferase [Actinopolymorpha rutila]|uniref:SAM-dependent methyltransferase n=1 Tax=Actinopolymorpha rutila TaxID=446787 RepID=A0A852ZHD6_9ACTN|nr:class I SAM-dependent methyltransferase [Actinopolymorpha rutila]NYH91328.1 SAM-dependent methyltransferase [Actinopolymorpha rutila]
MKDSSAEQRETWDQIAAGWSPDDAVETASTTPMIDFLAQLAGDGAALEFAIGTGRIGVPLARRGVSVAGIDVSPAMVDVLHAAMPAVELPVTVGSMATADAPGRDYQLVFLIANAITCLLHQDEQIACFRNAARHLRPGGYFVIQAWVPQLRQLPPGQSVVPATATDTLLIFDSYDLVSQRLSCHHYNLKNGLVVSTSTSHHRYVWPSEMDVMAKMAGLELMARYASWDRAEFTGDSYSSVSVWQKPRCAGHEKTPTTVDPGMAN